MIRKYGRTCFSNYTFIKVYQWAKKLLPQLQHITGSYEQHVDKKGSDSHQLTGEEQAESENIFEGVDANFEELELPIQDYQERVERNASQLDERPNKSLFQQKIRPLKKLKKKGISRTEDKSVIS